MLPGVVIAVYNEAETLKQNLPILVQQFEEIVVVDNWSEDHTPKVCEAFPIRWIRPETRLKRGQCWNIGAQHIQAETLLFLHIDTQIPPEALRQWQQLWEQGDCEYSCFQIRFPENAFKFRLLEAFSNFRSRRLRIVYGDQGLSVKKMVFEELGGFPDEFLLEDLKFSQRLKPEHAFRYISSVIIPSSRKFRKLGFLRYIFLMIQALYLNWRGVDTQTIYELYYRG